MLTDAELAAHLAKSAGKILLQLRAANMADGKALGNIGDQTANQFLVDALGQHRPDDGLLSEESKDTKERLAMERVWIIDPIDGTREYGEQRTDWAVHVGLAIGGKPVAGAVALPALDAVLRSDRPCVVPPAPGRLRLVVSRTRPPEVALALSGALDAEILPMGSAGAKAMAIVRGEADIYLHAGGQFEWDSCGPVAVALAHGLHCSRIDGSEIAYNQPDTYLPDLLICRQEHAEATLRFVAQFQAGKIAPTS
ncbi:MAG: 3'(2'),5'-bisphosphate nucleotidase CysQ [Sphingopyxis sp.]|nr:3'(2'),5'-bisphosphate nucleotidase CysQ [Sphingopyxis sp.]